MIAMLTRVAGSISDALGRRWILSIGQETTRLVEVGQLTFKTEKLEAAALKDMLDVKCATKSGKVTNSSGTPMLLVHPDDVLFIVRDENGERRSQ